MNEHSSPTNWLRRLEQGQDDAARKLWEAYYGKLVFLARRKLGGRTRLVGDEEDVALSAFKSFCRGLEAHRSPNLADRDDLWRLLVSITMHKVLHLVRDEKRKKRGGDWNQLVAQDDQPPLVEGLAGDEPDPQIAAQIAEEYERLLNCLPSPDLIELALLKMEGYSNADIARRWGKTERTVERKLNLIRQFWSHRT